MTTLGTQCPSTSTVPDAGLLHPQDVLQHGTAASDSAMTIISKSLDNVDLGTVPKNNSGKKRSKPDNRSDDLLPAQKKNRDYLPKASKPLYFDLKKNFHKMSQWTAHKQFLDNCGTTSNYPHLLQWRTLPPWSFNNQELYTRWAAVQQTAPGQLCQIISTDCDLKITNCQGVLNILTDELKGLIEE